MATPIIYLTCFPMHDNSHFDYAGFALAEDGTCLANHISSSPGWSKRDMQTANKIEAYTKHYPGGYTLEWVDDPEAHEGYQRALALNKQQQKQENNN